PVDGVTCTLIDAINSANSDTAVGGCASGDGDDVIELAAGSTHTLVEVNNDWEGPNGLPVIRSNITIEGHESTIQRDSAAPAFRIFAKGYDYVDFTIRETTITGGASSGAGGGVLDTVGQLTLIGSTVAGNNAAGNGGGVACERYCGRITLVNSTVSGNTSGGSGGGVFAPFYTGVLTVIDTTVSGNTAMGSGGGVASFGGPLTLKNSIVTDNIAGGAGGGVLANRALTAIDSNISGNTASGDGGGARAFTGLVLTNSTVSSNTAGGDGGGLFAKCAVAPRDEYGCGAFALANSAISGNRAEHKGGGLFFNSSPFYDFAHVMYPDIADTTISGNVAGDTGGGVSVFDNTVLTFSRSIVSGNEAPVAAEIEDATYETIVDNYNLFGLDGDAGVIGFTLGITDIMPAAGVLLDDILNPTLADNGGPTLTHALVPGSPAIDAIPIDDAGCTGTDQRGVTRPQGAGCDIGAVEYTGDAVSVSGDFTINHLWRRFCPEGFGEEAVVLLGPPTYNGHDPGVVRMRPADDAECSYQVRFQEWDYQKRDFLDDLHKREQVSYLGLSPGVYAMDDGSIWEVGRFDLSGTGYWKPIGFETTFADVPALFLTMQTTNGGQAATVRARAVGADGFEVALFEEEYLMGSGHSAEDIGYVAIYHPDAGSADAFSGQAQLNGMNYSYTLQRIWANHRWTGVDGVELKLEEERSLDAEIGHMDEGLDVLRIGDQVFAQQVTSRGGDTTALRRR
ncbi:MAG: choice-of-anchor Q domain-containing protein, partial [Anaerolineae bacterium]